MAHYAELNENNEVIYVAYMDNEIITDENGQEVEQLGIDHLHEHHGSHRRWVRTSYGGNFRDVYASVGSVYLEHLDIFTPPKPYSFWTFDENTKQWVAPIPYPNDPNGQEYYWNEEQYILNGNGWIPND